MTPADIQLPSRSRHASFRELPSLSAIVSPLSVRVWDDILHLIFFLSNCFQSDTARCELAYSLAQSHEASFSSLRLSELQREQLKISESQSHIGRPSIKVRKSSPVSSSHIDTEPLPRTLDDALRPSRRAIVITEATAPYRIVDVNDAWVDLCGYTYLESKGKKLGDLLKGPATDTRATTAMMHQLLHGEEVGTTLVNYTKSGRSFRNRLRAGPLLEGDRVTHFVGILQEVA